jgi:hypothetical protein
MNIGGNIDSDRQERSWRMPNSLTADVRRAAMWSIVLSALGPSE